MRAAVVSDIHGNLEALEAVLADAERRGVDTWICLGDVVGYGADPDACLRRVRALGGVVLRGNHDAAVANVDEVLAYRGAALDGIVYAREKLSEDDVAYLAALPLSWREHPVIAAAHASPCEPERWEYVIDEDSAARALEALDPHRIGLVGHSHVPTIAADDGTMRRARRGETVALEPERRRVIVNPGSVGQPRDGDPDAAWAIVEDDPWRVTFVRVPYDRETAARKIVEAGLPRVLAERLHTGT